MQRLLKDSDFSFFFFFFILFFKGISGVNSGIIIIISGVREEVFFFLFGGQRLPYLPSHFFSIIITKVKLLQGWSLICLFLNLNLNVNLNVELNLNLKLTKAPLADIQVSISSKVPTSSRITYIYI